MKNAIIFGGSGFIGGFFAQHLIENCFYKKVYILDIESPMDKESSFRKNQFLELKDKISFVKCDVRKSINWFPNESIELIANFAAIHREPGHKDYEYFETNIKGAENVCEWASKISCKSMIFSSSISPYGIEDIEKNEESLPVPSTAYGSSKLVAEKIHINWQEKNIEDRTLVIVRPGVVFGPGEGGNVSRLIKAIKKRYFVYIGNQKIRKAGVYVKELSNAMTWCLNKAAASESKIVLFNMTMNPGPSIEEYANAILKVLNKNYFFPRLPFSLLLLAAHLISLICWPLGIKHPFSPVRIIKLKRANEINPKFLIDNNYKFLFDLENALLDWKKDCPQEW